MHIASPFPHVSGKRKIFFSFIILGQDLFRLLKSLRIDTGRLIQSKSDLSHSEYISYSDFEIFICIWMLTNKKYLIQKHLLFYNVKIDF